MQLKELPVLCELGSSFVLFSCGLLSIFCYLPCFLVTGSGTTLRLKQMGMEFTVWVFKHVKSFFYILQLGIMFVLCNSREYEIHIHSFCENAMKDHTNLRRLLFLFYFGGSSLYF